MALRSMYKQSLLLASPLPLILLLYLSTTRGSSGPG